MQYEILDRHPLADCLQALSKNGRFQGLAIHSAFASPLTDTNQYTLLDVGYPHIGILVGPCDLDLDWHYEAASRGAHVFTCSFDFSFCWFCERCRGVHDSVATQIVDSEVVACFICIRRGYS